MSDQLTEQDQQDIRDLTDDFLAFEAAARGPESRFAPGDRVTPTFAADVEIGTVLATAPAHWATQNCYPGPQSSHAGAKWASGAVEVCWPKLGAAWWPADSLQKVGA